MAFGQNVINSGNDSIINHGSPSSNNIQSLATDSKGNLWVGTKDVGIFKYDGSSWSVFDTNNSDLPSNWFATLTIDENDRTLAAIRTRSYWDILFKYDNQGWKKYDLPKNEWGLSPEIGNITSLAADKLGSLWAGTACLFCAFLHGTGVVQFNEQTWTQYFVDYYKPFRYPFRGPITSISFDANENTWIGTGGIGIVKFNGNKWVVFDTSNAQIPTNYISEIILEKDGTLWAGSARVILRYGAVKIENGSGSGLIKFDGRTWQTFDTSNSNIPGNTITTLLVDGDGSIWIGTDTKGIAKFDGNDWKIFNTDNSLLPSNRIQALALDSNKNVWVGTDRGLALIRTDNLQVVIKGENFTQKTLIKSNLRITPNPLNSTATIEVRGLPSIGGQTFQLSIYDLNGRLIREWPASQVPDYEAVVWNGQDLHGRDVASGTYIVRVTVGERVRVKRIVLMR